MMDMAIEEKDCNAFHTANRRPVPSTMELQGIVSCKSTVFISKLELEKSSQRSRDA